MKNIPNHHRVFPWVGYVCFLFPPCLVAGRHHYWTLPACGWGQVQRSKHLLPHAHRRARGHEAPEAGGTSWSFPSLFLASQKSAGRLGEIRSHSGILTVGHIYTPKKDSARFSPCFGLSFDQKPQKRNNWFRSLKGSMAGYAYYAFARKRFNNFHGSSTWITRCLYMTYEGFLKWW